MNDWLLLFRFEIVKPQMVLSFGVVLKFKYFKITLTLSNTCTEIKTQLEEREKQKNENGKKERDKE